MYVPIKLAHTLKLKTENFTAYATSAYDFMTCCGNGYGMYGKFMAFVCDCYSLYGSKVSTCWF